MEVETVTLVELMAEWRRRGDEPGTRLFTFDLDLVLDAIRRTGMACCPACGAKTQPWEHLAFLPAFSGTAKELWGNAVADGLPVVVLRCSGCGLVRCMAAPPEADRYVYLMTDADLPTARVYKAAHY
ncbi:MAG TPA: hypothetical protein DCZ72_15595 [Armatimonadetes bacterium]|nr:hypothetical protein [Armatimonadota bacterium]